MPKGQRGTSRPYPRGKRKIYWIKYYVDGKPKYESSKSRNISVALKLLNQRRTENDHGLLVASDVTVANLLDLVAADYKKKRRSSWKDVETYKSKHLGPSFGRIAAKDVTSRHINSYIEQKRREGLSDGTIDRTLAVLNRAFSLGRKHTPPLVTSLLKIEKIGSENVRTGFLEHPDYLRLREALPDHQKTILVIAYHLGLRRGEILKLQWSQVDWDENLLRLQGRQTKNKTPRVAPLYGELREWFLHLHDSRASEFIVNWHGEGIVEHKTAWQTGVAEIDLPGLLLHDLRRTALRKMIRAGVPVKQAMLISGHKTMSVFMRYDILNEQDIQDAARKMDAYDKVVTKKCQAIETSKQPRTLSAGRSTV